MGETDLRLKPAADWKRSEVLPSQEYRPLLAMHRGFLSMEILTGFDKD